ncbi:MAG: hypothetical protein DI628_06950 [Blastochloris viridis]|uniref:Biotin synthesis protein BioC n=1 Tax=Blastochloris viridis TaxID=1079 RepID=A0A6N4R020_BLAVI|nr:MAG: hypothetical protein DI628_06950 [Blastochloris viridis]
MTENLFDAEQIARRLGRMRDAPVRAELTRRLEERLGEVKGDYKKVLRVTREDFTAEPEAYDAVLVDMLLPTMEDVPVFLYRCLQALRPDGVLLATTLGVESFREFRAAWNEIGHVVPLTDVQEAGALLQKLKVALPVVDRDMLTVTFKGFDTMYESLRDHGVGNFSTRRTKGLTGTERFAAMQVAYADMFMRSDGRLPVTVEVLYLHGFKPAASQPSAAKRGSGKVSLVRIVGNNGSE